MPPPPPLRRRTLAATPRRCAAAQATALCTLPPPSWQEVIKEVIDSPDMGRRGEAYFAAQVALALLVAFPPGFLRPLADAAGWLAVGGGLGLLVAGQQALGANLSPLPKPRDSATLVTTGARG